MQGIAFTWSKRTCTLRQLHLQDLNTHKRIKKSLHAILTDAEFPSYLSCTQGLLGLQKQVENTLLTCWKDHLQSTERSA